MFHFQRRKRQKMNSIIAYFCFLLYQPLIVYAKLKMISNLKMRINLFSMRVGQSRVMVFFFSFRVRLETIAVKEVKRINSMID